MIPSALALDVGGFGITLGSTSKGLALGNGFVERGGVRVVIPVEGRDDRPLRLEKNEAGAVAKFEGEEVLL